MKEIKLVPSSNLPENVLKEVRTLLSILPKELRKYSNTIFNLKLGTIIFEEESYKPYIKELESWDKKIDLLSRKVENIADEYSEKDDYNSYSDWMDIDNELTKQGDRVKSLIFILELCDDLRQDFDDAEHHKKSFLQI